MSLKPHLNFSQLNFQEISCPAMWSNHIQLLVFPDHAHIFMFRCSCHVVHIDYTPAHSISLGPRRKMETTPGIAVEGFTTEISSHMF